MKLRESFVTNSSSSSYVVLMKNNDNLAKLYELKKKFESDNVKELIIGEKGNVEFGRRFQINEDFYSKLNYLTINMILLEKETYYVNIDEKIRLKFDTKKDYRKLLNEIILSDFNITLVWSKIEKMIEQYDAFIDHESLYTGMDLILQSDTEIRNFLYNENSILVNDSDECCTPFKFTNIYFDNNKNLYNISYDYQTYTGVEIPDVDVISDHDYEYLIINSDKESLVNNYLDSEGLSDEELKLFKEKIFIKDADVSYIDDIVFDNIDLEPYEDYLEENFYNKDKPLFKEYLNYLSEVRRTLSNKIYNKLKENPQNKLYSVICYDIIDIDDYPNLNNKIQNGTIFKNSNNVFRLRLDW